MRFILLAPLDKIFSSDDPLWFGHRELFAIISKQNHISAHLPTHHSFTRRQAQALLFLLVF